MARRRRIKLDVVRIDVLLWTLGGFEERQTPDAHGMYPLWAWQQIVDISRRGPLPGETATMARRLGASAGGLRSVIYQVRHGRHPPKAYQEFIAA